MEANYHHMQVFLKDRFGYQADFEKAFSKKEKMQRQCCTFL